jgi:hypothetical protein
MKETTVPDQHSTDSISRFTVHIRHVCTVLSITTVLRSDSTIAVLPGLTDELLYLEESPFICVISNDCMKDKQTHHEQKRQRRHGNLFLVSYNEHGRKEAGKDHGGGRFVPSRQLAKY